MTRWALLLPFFAVACKTPAQGSQVLVRNGIETSGYTVVGRVDAGTGSCTGTLVCEDVVLTAKHCFKDGKLGKLDFFWPYKGAAIRMVELATLPGQDDSEDLVVARLDKPAPIEGDETYPTLADEDDGAPSGLGTIVGYGVTAVASDGPQTKRTGLVLIDGFIEARPGGSAYGHKAIKTSPTDKQQLACNGDSGGPLLASDGRLLGVLSIITYDQTLADGLSSLLGNGGPSDATVCKRGKANVYASVAVHHAFITEKIDQWCHSSR